MFPKYYQLLIVAVFIFIQIADINNYQDSRYLNDSYDNKLPALRRYGRQTGDSGCVIPVNPLHTKYKILGQTAYSTNSGDYIPNFVSAEIICDKGFKLSPLAPKRSICNRGKWTPPLSNCLRACRSLTSIISTNVSCMHGTTPLNNCYDAVEDTTALMSCNPLYEDSSIDNNPIHLCSGGKWEPPIPQCNPVCGQKRPKGTVNIINGIDVERGDYPWHVGIYNASDQRYLCGGAIIERNIILSAAHCFADYNGNVFPPDKFLIAAGKYHRIYNHESDIYAQYSKIQKINIPERYKGIETFHALDIAVLIMETPFLISPTVQPVCIELNQQLQSLHLTSNSIGIVTGWGYTQEGDQLADILKEVQIPFIPYEKCYDEVPRSFRKYLNDDKFCGGYRDLATSICTGDSGGGLVFHNRMNDRFYVKGIVSTSPATISQTCDSNQYSLYSSIAVHTKFIRDIITRNRLRYYVECKYDKCASKDATEKPTDDDEVYDRCCVPEAQCRHFYTPCKDHQILRRMVDMLL